MSDQTLDLRGLEICHIRAELSRNKRLQAVWHDLYREAADALTALRSSLTRIEQEWPHQHKPECELLHEVPWGEPVVQHGNILAGINALSQEERAARKAAQSCTCGLADALASLVNEHEAPESVSEAVPWRFLTD